VQGAGKRKIVDHHAVGAEQASRHLSSGMASDFKLGSKAYMTACLHDVRFTPQSGHCLAALPCLLCANRRHCMHVKLKEAVS
jgi:hypothetical protein